MKTIKQLTTTKNTATYSLAALLVLCLVALAALFLSAARPAAAQTIVGPSDPAAFVAGKGTVTARTVSGTISSATITTIVTPATDKSVVVWGFFLAGEATVKPVIKSSAVQIFAPVPLTVQTGIFPPVKNIATDTPYFRTWSGQALVITTDTAGPLDYWFKYTEE